MKKILLYLSALFLSVSFANAQTQEYVISSSTGTLLETGVARSSEWTANNCPAGLKITATNSDGDPVNTITNWGERNKFYAASTDTQETPVTYTLSVDAENYVITGYSLTYYPSTANKVTLTNDNGYIETPSNNKIDSYMVASGLKTKSTSFTVEASATNPSTFSVNVVQFTVTVEQVGGAQYTVSVSAGQGGTATVNGAAEATTTGEATLVAVPDYGYKFVNWTIGTEAVSTSAEYTATVNGDTEFVANFAKFENTDEWYAAIDKPTFVAAGSTTSVAMVEFNGVNVSGFTYTSGTTSSLTNEALSVAPGETYSLNVTYDMKWGDIALFQIDCDGAEKKYGYYTCAWEAYANPLTILERDNSNFMCEEFGIEEFSELAVDGTYLTLPYEVTISENAQPGDLVVLRAIIGKKNAASNTAYDKNIVEGGCLDIVCVVAEKEEPALSHTLTVTEDGWATLFLGFNAVIPEGVEAYIVKNEGINDTYISLTQVTGVLPANTGVIIKAPAGEYKLFNEATATADVTGNLLEGTLYNRNIDVEAYVLGNVDGVGLYKAEMTDGTWLNNANKAYLPASVVPNKSAAFYGFDWNGTTGVEKVEIGNEKSEIYDLTGRRVETITEPGIYIVNGVKKLVR